mmetsp:Transcript_44465/g.105371  ORF Transcript_44465/g.105371 Transcript_44465/m.105371 type:complete len:429 (+) Transcript_44465:110-1396(+)|eukprot:CAMPEP_0178420096 /NCGR_PEP_ID=MMETSP0689_2-20121128/25953_1 /TAXON_ID=160604 /ORGANISM="Amphidinium massartii, Strain CS-259" /LENGTH=428 /DNA_ID=CAMNT_0020041561 /DNA_START=1 /DNA_END=1287 /DNA_ORIENTATION=-
MAQTPSIKGIWKHDKLTASLPKFFERKILSTALDAHVNCEPPGYRTEFDAKLGEGVLRHEATGVRVCGHVIDLVERVDRTKRPESATIIFVYSPLEVLKPVAELAQREPTKAFQELMKVGALKPLHSGGHQNDDDDGDEELALGRTRTIYRWLEGATLAEPASLVNGRQALAGQPGSYCVALHLETARLRRAAGQDSPLVLLREAKASPMEVELGVCLVEAATNRDEETLRSLLRKRADVHFRDVRGWTALHAACSVRPCWPILNSLLQRGSDVCARTRDGLMPYDIAERAEHHDIAEELQRRLRQHKTGKFLPHAHVGMGGGASNEDFAHTMGRRVADEDAVPLLRDFAAVLMGKYENAVSAFKAFDINNNGSLSGSEFVQYARLLNFQGDLMVVFKALDKDRLGDISVEEFKLLQNLHSEGLDEEE